MISLGEIVIEEASVDVNHEEHVEKRPEDAQCSGSTSRLGIKQVQTLNERWELEDPVQPRSKMKKKQQKTKQTKNH